MRNVGDRELGKATKLRPGRDAGARGYGIDTRTNRIHCTGDFVAEHTRYLGSVGIHPDSCHQVGEVQPGSLHLDAHLARAWLRVGTLLDSQHVVRAMARENHGAHVRPLTRAEESPGTRSCRACLRAA